MYDSCLDVAIAGGGGGKAHSEQGGETKAKGSRTTCRRSTRVRITGPSTDDHGAAADDEYAHEDGVAAEHAAGAGTVSVQHAGEDHGGAFDSESAKAEAAARDHTRGAAKADSGLTHVMDDGHIMAGPEMSTFRAASADEPAAEDQDEAKDDESDSAVTKGMKATAQSVEDVRRQMLRFFKGKPPGASAAESA
ncbi:hypothetical protein AMAG_19006 [Allomyces macrogynus ATCC 38327]|uniref:Uncharacterized protein n=1 Tax=Allomyces macrogynus (strain ATCC 38327) TaxID=578462 RepID=A0A0L0SM04_ALLM3|nr:hypothetical protein AMAG_19006 [Allomyces macrogynus ATCC 38327]|eukprot:KNE63473.1 hypothetical protein AMAG_19006 [Allomyces macrogynus ATCC 38327]